ncbi:MAG TPA: hypothetical protein VLH19_00140 [Patescibacteria group bacterium]|nr:hypothetical protein [Patescibacteria group bacterium]
MVFDSKQIGHKAQTLQTLSDHAVVIPQGFIVTSDTMRAVFELNKLDMIHDPKELFKAISRAALPRKITQQIFGQYIALGNPNVFVLASPPEFFSHLDLTPFFDIHGEAVLIEAIRTTWAQYASEVLQSNIHLESFPYMAICVQTQPKAVLSGVLETQLLRAGQKTHLSIAVVTGDAALQGNLSRADHYTIDRISGEYKYFPENPKTNESLSPRHREQLLRFVKTLQQALFFPQECTVIYDGTQWVLIDTRPLHKTGNLDRHDKTLHGQVFGAGIIEGQIAHFEEKSERLYTKNTIIVTTQLSSIPEQVFKRIGGVICEAVQPVCVQTVWAKAYDVLLFSGVSDALRVLHPGMRVTMHSPTQSIIFDSAKAMHTQKDAPPEVILEPWIRPTLKIETSTHRNETITISLARIFSALGVNQAHSDQKHFEVLRHTLHEKLMKIIRNYRPQKIRLLLADTANEKYFEIDAWHSFEDSLLEREVIQKCIRETTVTFEIDIPFARNEVEVIEYIRKLKTANLPRSARCRYGVVVSVPSLLALAPVWLGFGIDHVIVDVDSIVTFLGAVSSAGQLHFEHHPAIEALRCMLPILINSCEREGIPYSFLFRSAPTQEMMSTVLNGLHKNVILPDVWQK